MGVQSWQKFLKTLGKKFDKDQWKLVINALADLFQRSLPRDLLSDELKNMLEISTQGSTVEAAQIDVRNK